MNSSKHHSSQGIFTAHQVNMISFYTLRSSSTEQETGRIESNRNDAELQSI